MHEAERSFWDFSVETYARDGAKQACLSLQDEQGADVNVLLLCCFVARHGVRLTEPAVVTIARQAAAWQQEVVMPLRGVRRRLKQPVGSVLPDTCNDLRRGLERLELQAEKLEQEMLQAVLRTVGGHDGRDADRRGLARRNMLAYLSHLGVGHGPPVREALERLIDCAFPETAR